MSRHVSFDAEAFLKSVILLGFSTFLFVLIKSNHIIYYINPRFIKLTEAAALLIFFMFLAQAARSLRLASTSLKPPHRGHAKINFVLLPFVITLLMAFLTPDRALDASMAQNKGANLAARPAASAQPEQANENRGGAEATDSNQPGIPEDTARTEYSVHPKVDQLRRAQQITVDEDNFSLATGEINMYPDKYAGKEITMLGFVFKDKSYPPQQFGLLRYVVSCCSADAVPDGFLCEYARASELSEGSWLKIHGTLQMGEYENEIIPVIKVTSISRVQEPKNPYVYPINF
jgi:putative membrane protein